jgi:hypothetical protein
MIFRFLPLLFGIYFAYAGAGSLALAVVGEPVDAMVDETVVKAVKALPAADGAAASYVMRTKVAYHFEVCPRQAPAADAPCVKAEGSDTLIMRTPYSVLDRDKGYAVPAVFLRFAPRINAVLQPRHLVVYGLLELLLGLAIAAFEISVLRRERRDRLAAAAKASGPAADPEALWRDLESPIDSGGSDFEPPDEDIQPS